ncbi:winged helix-turn-helix domain-containing protein [Candidatus Pacearchaeota archaeon]|nr:winged helix-turn-helix domain-containing protein [Candidatus Pacearchaeota archaeon]
MRFDSFLSSPRWEILELISKKPLSPIELAEKLNTTVSYVSQQLKLLDAAGIVKKEKTGASEKGKPRALFRLSDEILYLTILTHNFSAKKSVNLTNHHKAILSIWMIEDSSLHFFFEKLFWKLHENLKEIQGIFLERTSTPRLLILSDSKTLKSKIESYVGDFEKKINYSFVTETQINKLKLAKEDIFSLYEKETLELNNLNKKENDD